MPDPLLQFISVGWGKKETQFHGSEGKAAALAASKHSKAPLVAVDDAADDGLARAVWRDDGQARRTDYKDVTYPCQFPS